MMRATKSNSTPPPTAIAMIAALLSLLLELCLAGVDGGAGVDDGGGVEGTTGHDFRGNPHRELPSKEEFGKI